MAFTSSNGRTQTALADINITPLVDVVLVLLIIFMVTAPVLQSGIEVSVPKTRTVKEITEERIVITINKDQRVFLGNDAININQIASSIRQRVRDPRRRECALWRLRYSHGRRKAVGNHQCEHRHSAFGSKWRKTLRSFSSTIVRRARWAGRPDSISPSLP